MMTRSKVKDYLALNGIIFLYSIAIISSKLASGYPFLSREFIFYYAVLNIMSAIYAIVWQQVIKRIPLNTAYATKSMGILWGILWGRLLFMEKVTPLMIVGSVTIFAGILLVVNADE